jgi:hypothetical protein
MWIVPKDLMASRGASEEPIFLCMIAVAVVSPFFALLSLLPVLLPLLPLPLLMLMLPLLIFCWCCYPGQTFEDCGDGAATNGVSCRPFA